MKRRPNRKRADDARDLALAIFGATSADDVRMQRMMDRQGFAAEAHTREVRVDV